MSSRSRSIRPTNHSTLSSWMQVASMYRLYMSRARDGRPTCGVVLLDEAFGKMDEWRIEATLTYARNLGLQLVLATPKERSELVAPKVERSILIHKDPISGLPTV